MKRFNILLTCGLLLATALTEAHSFIRLVYPEIDTRLVKWFINGGVELSLAWWVKMSADEFLLVLSYFCMAVIAYRYSFRTFLIVVCFEVYWALDACLFFYNYKQTYWVFWFLLALLGFVVAVLMWPIKETGKYKSML